MLVRTLAAAAALSACAPEYTVEVRTLDVDCKTAEVYNCVEMPWFFLFRDRTIAACGADREACNRACAEARTKD